jgi:hypothetical protein
MCKLGKHPEPVPELQVLPEKDQLEVSYEHPSYNSASPYSRETNNHAEGYIQQPRNNLAVLHGPEGLILER